MDILTRPCVACRNLFNPDEMVDQYVVVIHGFNLTERRLLCPECAKAEESRRTRGGVDDYVMENIVRQVEHVYGKGAAVKWLQGDELKALIHVYKAVRIKGDIKD